MAGLQQVPTASSSGRCTEPGPQACQVLPLWVEQNTTGTKGLGLQKTDLQLSPTFHEDVSDNDSKSLNAHSLSCPPLLSATKAASSGNP